MIILKCDTCKKEIETAFEISINRSPYTVANILKREQLVFTTTKSKSLCVKCYEEVMSIIYPQGEEKCPKKN